MGVWDTRASPPTGLPADPLGYSHPQYLFALHSIFIVSLLIFQENFQKIRIFPPDHLWLEMLQLRPSDLAATLLSHNPRHHVAVFIAKSVHSSH